MHQTKTHSISQTPGISEVEVEMIRQSKQLTEYDILIRMHNTYTFVRQTNCFLHDELFTSKRVSYRESQCRTDRFTEHETKVQLRFNIKLLQCDDAEEVKDVEMNFVLIITFKSSDHNEASSTFHQVLDISSSEMLLQWPLVYESFPSPFTTSQCAKGKRIPFQKCLE